MRRGLGRRSCIKHRGLIERAEWLDRKEGRRRCKNLKWNALNVLRVVRYFDMVQVRR